MQKDEQLAQRSRLIKQAAERAAINAPLQGSAADIIKMAMIAVDQMLPKDQTKMLLQVHDELVFDVHHSEKEIMQQLVKEAMENAVKLVVPMEVEVKLAQNWLDAH